MNPFSIYVHIPFCLQRCPYCDFNTYALTSIPERQYIPALQAELDLRASQPGWKDREVQSVYFGGGTPSLLPANAIQTVLKTIRGLFPWYRQAEVSIEANPGTIDGDRVRGYREAGVNRISIGGQSFDPLLLKTLGRIHSAEQTEAAVESARHAGFTNISLDIMYGIPGESLEQLARDLKEAVRLDPRHVSAYGLTVEKGTPFYSRYSRGKLKLPDEETVLAMMRETKSFLAACGYRRYEISNFSEPGHEARHNLVYWGGGDYLGIGAGAHSLLVEYQGERRRSGRRWANFPLPNAYMSHASAHGQAESWRDTLTEKDLMFEYFFLGLRKAEGVSLAQFERFFGQKADNLYGAVMQVLVEQGLITREDDRAALTDRGVELADSVIENFISPDRSAALPSTSAVAALQ